VLVCRESTGVIVGVVPLVLRGRRLLAAGEQLADWFGPACAPEDEARVAAAAVMFEVKSGLRPRLSSAVRRSTQAGSARMS